VIVSTFVSTAGTSTLPVYIFSSLRLGLKGDIAAISTIALLVTLTVLGLTALVLRRGGGSAEEVAATLTGG
jgi:spermidine/putrescine transport system permease protein